MGKHGIRGPIAALRVVSILTLIVAALLWAPTAALGLKERQVIRIDLGDKQRYQRIHPVVPRVADDVPSAGGEGDLGLSRDRGVESGEEEGRGVGYRVEGRHPQRRHVGGLPGGQPPPEIAVALPGRTLAGGQPTDAKPGMIRQQGDELLSDRAGGAENTYINSSA